MREKFSNTGLIPVSQIYLDQRNYRLGPTENQLESIDLMFEVFGNKIVKLAEHMAREGLSPKPIVVLKDGDGHWVVKDGNRRITALKVLNNPSEAPTDHYKHIFEDLKSNTDRNKGLDKVDCLTADEETVRKYMELEHMGPQDGIGQINWGAIEKENLLADSGEKYAYPQGMAVREYLISKGVAEAKNIPITNIQRLFGDADITEALGMKWSGEQFVFHSKEEELFEVVKTICLDFIKKDKGVKNIYHKEDRTAYLNELFKTRGLKQPAILKSSQSFAGTSSGTQSQNAAQSSATGNVPLKTKLPQDRGRVIQRGLSLPVPDEEIKINTILVELGSRIDVRKATIAASVLLRLLIEYSVESYAKRNGITQGKNEHLHHMIDKTAQKMKSDGNINQKQLQQLQKMKNSDELLSAHTLNAWIHNRTFIPDSRQVCTFWDNIRFFLFYCWK